MCFAIIMPTSVILSALVKVNYRLDVTRLNVCYVLAVCLMKTHSREPPTKQHGRFSQYDGKQKGHK